ncbi:MAG: hypothetical protein K0V04_43840 [Deltaproteobacteria bacterium]|nr:hypothetical protein [Deltaproteobacteria bacterium]
MLGFTWRLVPFVAAWSTALTAAHVFFGLEWLRAPGMLVAVIGTAVSFYLGFKGSAAYDRLWEARKIWGGIVNTSRTWGIAVRTLVSDAHLGAGQEPTPPIDEVHRELIYRHIAWLAALRTQLRRRKPWEHDADLNNQYRRLFGTHDNSDEILRQRVEPFVGGEELEALMAQKNRATQLIRRQAERLQQLYGSGRIESFRHMELVRLLETMFTLQGKCERLKNFPLPRQYASANHWFVHIFIAVLPFGLLSSLHVDGLGESFVWLTVPGSIVVGWMFYMWDQVLDYSENPFEGLVNDIPMTALSRTIEIDLREFLGERELPAAIESHNDVLM